MWTRGAAMIFFLIGCGQELDISSHTWIEEHETIEFSYHTLKKPQGLISYGGGLLVTDSEDETISFLLNREQTVITDTLPAPNDIINHNDDVFFTTESSIEKLLVEEESSEILADNLVSPKRITWYNESLYWIEEGSLYVLDNDTPLALCLDLISPYDMIVWEDALWITTQEDKGLWTLDNEECTRIETFDDIPHRMTVSQQKLWITTRSFRWPYGGWVVSFDGNQLEKHTESPPEPEHILGWNNQIVWSSKQSITSFEETPYTMLAAQTTIGALVVVEDTLYWSDPHGGRIGSINPNE